MVELDSYQKKAVSEMHNGCILCGKVGSGKSLTALFYYKENHKDLDLYIITTAKKRDDLEWEVEVAKLGIDKKVVVDSWNNIKKYRDVKRAFFIFDEQRVVGYGAWTKNFLIITRSNPFILLSATPGDKWTDYIPIFIANGYYRNKTEFVDRHIIYDRYSKFPKIDRYWDEYRLIRLRNNILVNMEYENNTIKHKEDVKVNYDIFAYKTLFRDRFDYEKNEPIKNAPELCYKLRRIINSDISRANAVLDIFQKAHKVIIFYNYDFELDILRSLNYHIDGKEVEVAEWNSHKHQPVPESDCWVYLVQYTSGSEGWNCVRTNTIIFYSLNYSYRQMIQAAGRIDRRNTGFRDLYYYYLQSSAPIDIAIRRALKNKKKFNESAFLAS